MAWNMGERSDGLDSEAELILPQSEWPEMRALILVANAGPKAIGSSVGMQMTVQTSSLFKERIERTVPERMKLMRKTILERDFRTFADLTMRDSNSFHATCLDTFPPIVYMNDVSKSIMMLVHQMNSQDVIAAYTCDAGPNVVIYFEDRSRTTVLGTFAKVFQDTKLSASRALQGAMPSGSNDLDAALIRVIAAGVTDLIGTGVGDGPRLVEDHLITAEGILVK